MQDMENNAGQITVPALSRQMAALAAAKGRKVYDSVI